MKAQFPSMSRFTCVVLFLATLMPSVLATEILTGRVGPRTITEDVLIPADRSCTLNGTIIRGRVALDANAKLVANNAQINGEIISLVGGIIDLKQSTVVNGPVQASRFRSITVRDRTTLKGGLTLTSGAAPARSKALVVNNATIWKDLIVVRTKGAIDITNSTIRATLNMAENSKGPFIIQNSRIRGDLSFVANKGSGLIANNRVIKDLIVNKNSPKPVVQRTFVSGDVAIE